MAYDLQAYVQQTKAVADAGRLLQGLLTEAEATRDYAAAQLADALRAATAGGGTIGSRTGPGSSGAGGSSIWGGGRSGTGGGSGGVGGTGSGTGGTV